MLQSCVFCNYGYSATSSRPCHFFHSIIIFFSCDYRSFHSTIIIHSFYMLIHLTFQKITLSPFYELIWTTFSKVSRLLSPLSKFCDYQQLLSRLLIANQLVVINEPMIKCKPLFVTWLSTMGDRPSPQEEQQIGQHKDSSVVSSQKYLN